MKKCYATPKTPDLVYFSSAYLPLPAGERIGVFTCKDILFKHPSSDLYSMGARLFIYSSRIPMVGRIAKDLWTRSHPGAYLVASDAANDQSGVFVNGTRLPYDSTENGRVFVTRFEMK
jgi:hypothetical protein